MKNIVRDALILFLITLTAGACLGLVWQITKDPIARAEERAKQKAYETVFQDASFSGREELEELAGQSSAYFEGKYGGSIILSELLEAAGEGGKPAGYVLTAVSREGYGGDIKFTIGIKKDGTITGFEILAMSETPGLGARCTEPAFKGQFAGLCAEQIRYTKTGKTEASEIDALSGATITTRAVTNGVNGVLAFLRDSGLVLSVQEGGHNE